MNNISSNIKKIALSLLVVGLAVGVQSFKSKQSSVAIGDQYGSRPASDPYEKLNEPYDPSECFGASSKYCFYTVTSAGAATVTASSYTEAELEAFANDMPAKVTRSSTTGIYNGN